MTSSAADPRHRTEVINSYKNLDDLTKELNNSGFDLRSSSLYLQLIPHKKDSTEGKRHTVAKVNHATVKESRLMVCGSHYETC